MPTRTCNLWSRESKGHDLYHNRVKFQKNCSVYQLAALTSSENHL